MPGSLHHAGDLPLQGAAGGPAGMPLCRDADGDRVYSSETHRIGPPAMHRLSLITSLCLFSLAACGDKTPTTAAAPAAAAAAKGDACASRPPESAADHQAKLTTFKSAAGFTPSFTQGQVLDDDQEIAITVSEPDFNDTLGYEIYYLADCAAFGYFSGNFYKQGDGRWSATVQTGTGSDIPDGTPAFIAVSRSQLIRSADGGMPSVKNTVVGEYAVRINNPKR